MNKSTMTVKSPSDAMKLAQNLIDESVPFYCEPYPHNITAFTVKNEYSEKLQFLIEEL